MYTSPSASAILATSDKTDSKLALVPEANPAAIGNPVQLVNVPEVGVPSIGVTRVGDVDSTVLTDPVDVVTPVPPRATASVPVVISVAEWLWDTAKRSATDVRKFDVPPLSMATWSEVAGVASSVSAEILVATNLTNRCINRQ